jgi:hypothetical protein
MGHNIDYVIIFRRRIIVALEFRIHLHQIKGNISQLKRLTQHYSKMDVNFYITCQYGPISKGYELSNVIVNRAGHGDL